MLIVDSEYENVKNVNKLLGSWLFFVLLSAWERVFVCVVIVDPVTDALLLIYDNDDIDESLMFILFVLFKIFDTDWLSYTIEFLVDTWVSFASRIWDILG